MKIKSGEEPDTEEYLDGDDDIQDLLASLISGELASDGTSVDDQNLFANLAYNTSVPPQLPSSFNFSASAAQQFDSAPVYRFQGAAGAASAQSAPVNARPVFGDYRISTPASDMSTAVNQANAITVERRELRDRLIKRRHNNDQTADNKMPSTSGGPASTASGQDTGKKPSKNAAQAKRNRLKKKEEERLDNLTIERLDHECQQHEKSNNSLRSEIMGHQAERSRLENAIKQDPELSKLLSLRIMDGVLDAEQFSPKSGGVCVSITDPSLPAKLCERCSRRFCACAAQDQQSPINSQNVDSDLHDLADMMSH